MGSQSVRVLGITYRQLAEMRLFLIANLLILSVGIGYSLRITEFLDPLFRNGNSNQPARQSEEGNDLEEQILPLFVVTFAASTLWNLITMGGTAAAEVNCDDYHWCYEGDCAADTWGTCVEACNGMSQSPIDVPAAVQMGSASASKPLAFADYQNVRIDVFGNTIEHYTQNGVNLGANGDRMTNNNLTNNGHTAQLDFHWGSDDTKGSEHTYSGREYPIEMHIVHTRSDFTTLDQILNTATGLAVTGFMFEVDSVDNTALKPLTDALQNIVDSKAKLPFGTSGFNLNDLISPVATTSEYTYYKGSLTTPTCNEVVEWINILTPLKISSRQLAMFRTLMDSKGKAIVDNYRPPQPLNGRVVTKYGQ